MGPSKALLKAIAVTAELTSTDLSPAAAEVMAADLAEYPEAQVMGALTRCRRELRGRMAIGDVIARLDDGRPGPEEAWAMIPKDEDSSVVWCEEMAQAFGIAGPLMDNPVQARMAFLEAYRDRVRIARERKMPAHWFPSMGRDVKGRESALQAAVDAGRISREHMAAISAPAEAGARLTGPGREKLTALLEHLKGKAA